MSPLFLDIMCELKIIKRKDFISLLLENTFNLFARWPLQHQVVLYFIKKPHLL